MEPNIGQSGRRACPRSFSPSFHLQENVKLAPLTTLGIGGGARFFFRAATESQVSEALEFATEKGVDLFVLGGGSNVLVSDRGFDGLVLQVAIAGSRFKVQGSKLGRGTEVTVGAGVAWDEFVADCVKEDLAGVECLSGIPGFVGGTPVQNVGAYGQEVSETIISVRCLDRTSLEFVTLSNAECGFGYRASIFNTTERDRFIVLEVTFRLVPDGRPKIAYPELERAVETPASLGDVRDAVLRLRRSKSMVIDPDDPNSRSAGSFFKNPVVQYQKLSQLQSEFPGVPFFAFGDRVKIPAAWLIEKAGFPKGFRLGNAGISDNHTLALINTNNATAAEMVDLMRMIQTGVAARFQINLVPEPTFVGF